MRALGIHWEVPIEQSSIYVAQRCGLLWCLNVLKMPLKWTAKPIIFTIRCLVRYLVGYPIKYEILRLVLIEKALFSFFHFWKGSFFREETQLGNGFLSAIGKKQLDGLRQN